MTGLVSETWLPTEWLHEVIPEPQAEPNTFLRAEGDSSFRIAPVDDSQWPDYSFRLAPGDTVEMSLYRIWPMIEVEIGAAGELVHHDPIPDGATRFWAKYAMDRAVGSLEDLARIWIANEWEPSVVDVEPFDWSISATFRLVVDEDGARIEKVEETISDG